MGILSAIATMPMPTLAANLDMNAINKMERATFTNTKTLGGVFENSPWVAQKAWDARPFDSMTQLHIAMVATAIMIRQFLVSSAQLLFSKFVLR